MTKPRPCRYESSSSIQHLPSSQTQIFLNGREDLAERSTALLFRVEVEIFIRKEDYLLHIWS